MLEFDSALDVFGGTGSVSYLLKCMNKAVTYNDYMRWNYLVGLALIQNDTVLLSNTEIESLLRPLVDVKGDFVTQTFKGLYFKTRENIWIDAIISRIADFEGKTEAQMFKAALAYYALFQTCLVKRPFNLFHRLNLSIRTADVHRSFGNKVTWEKPFPMHFRSFAEEVNRFVRVGRRRCSAINFEASEIPEAEYDLVYLDPPYVKRGTHNETADYALCYHFLEGLARYREWSSLINYSSRLKRISVPGVSDWTDVDRNKLAFERIFDKFNRSILVISYKKYGYPSVDTLIRMLKRLGKQVAVHTKHYKYALNQQNGSAKLNRECLIIAK